MENIILNKNAVVSSVSLQASDTSSTTISLPPYLIAIISILVVVAIIACIYKIFAYRRMSIAAKKIDYLVEDLIYKSEYIMPSIEAVSEFASYTNLTELVFNKNKSKSDKDATKNRTEKVVAIESKTEPSKITKHEVTNELAIKNKGNQKYKKKPKS